MFKKNSIVSDEGNLRKCCFDTLNENRRLKKALEKERNRRIYIFEAYKKLLDAYQSLVNLKEYVF